MTNLIFIGISAEFFTAFQFLGCIAEFRHGQEKRKTVDKVKCIIFGYFYVSVGIFQLILHRYLKDKLIAVLRVVRQLFLDSAFQVPQYVHRLSIALFATVLLYGLCISTV